MVALLALASQPTMASEESCNLTYTDCWGGSFSRTWTCPCDEECCVLYAIISPNGNPCISTAETKCCGEAIIPSPAF